MASRRAYADEYAVRVNRAVELLVDLSPADAVRVLVVEHALSERQARRYVNAALERPEGVWQCRSAPRCSRSAWRLR